MAASRWHFCKRPRSSSRLPHLLTECKIAETQLPFYKPKEKEESSKRHDGAQEKDRQIGKPIDKNAGSEHINHAAHAIPNAGKSRCPSYEFHRENVRYQCEIVGRPETHPKCGDTDQYERKRDALG